MVVEGKLQLAVACWDVSAVKILLTAGDDFIGTGSSNATKWEDGSIMSRFNHLHGLSPLYILYNSRRIPELANLWWAVGEADYSTIEDALKSHNARAFRVT